MAEFKEFLNGGLVTARDASVLKAGELQQADDCILRPYDPAVHRAPGRTAYGTVTAATAVKGLKHASFDDTSDLLLAYNATKLRYSTFTGDTGTYTDLITGLPDVGDEKLELVHYNNSYYALIGSTTPRRINYNRPTDGSAPVPTARAMGMEAVPDTAAYTTPFSVATGAGTWSSLLGNGVYWFLITEVVNADAFDEVEGTFVGTPKSVTITDYATQKAVVTRHSPFVNDGSSGRNTTTHWRVYMSARQPDTSLTPSVASFRLVATVSSAQTTWSGTDTNATTTANGATVVAFGAAPQFTNPSNMTGAVDGSSATSQNDSAANILRYSALNSGLTGTITGMEITLYGSWNDDGNSSAAGAWISVSKDNGTTEATSRREFRFDSNAKHVGGPLSFTRSITVGGPFDLWGTTMAASNLASGQFALIVGKISTAHNDQLNVNAVQVKVYAGGTVVNLDGDFFPVVSVDDGLGTTVPYGAYGPPPHATTGDIFDGQMALNDVLDKSLLRYSLPDRPEAFPSIYFLNFETKKADEITCLRKVGSILVVGMTSQIKRVNYLPREQDAEFDRGRAYEDVASDVGIAGPLAATLFDMPGSGPVLAFVAQNGLWVTDGMTARPLNEDLDWQNTIEPTKLGNAILVNYPKLYTLIMYYTPTGGTTNTKALYFNYHNAHVKDGGTLPAYGPVSVSARSATGAEIAGVTRVLTGHNTDGVSYLEDSGVTDASGGALAPILRTRLLYPNDVGGEGRVEKVYLRVTANGTRTGTTTDYSGTGLCTLTVRKQNIQEAVTDLESKDFNTVTGGLVVMDADDTAEAFEFKVAKTQAAAMRIHYIAGRFASGDNEENRA